MKNCVVTGANRGIGLEYCRQLKQRGEQVVAVCRQSTPELEALNIQIQTGVDITDAHAVASLGHALKETAIDILINNAGVLIKDTLQNCSISEVRRLFESNALAPLLITRTLLQNLKNAAQKNGIAKVILMTSRMGSIADNSSGGYYAYRISKASLNMIGASLAHDLKKDNIAVALLHPGFVKTDMTANQGNIDAKTAVKNLIQRIDELTLENSGTFWHAEGNVLPW